MNEMNEIKIYLKTSGSFAELYKDFNLYQGCYRNSQISVYVPRSILYANAENTFANLVKVGGILTAPNGTKLTTKSYYLDYVKEETVNTIDYAVYTTITPKEFCVYAGTQTVVVNVENIDNTNAETPTILSVTTTQTANLIVLESAYLGQDEPIDPTELEKLRATLTVIQENVTELQTSVTGLRGEVSGIQTDLEQVHTDLGEKANKDYVDTELGKKLDKTGGPINGDLLVGGELRVLDDTIIIGNLTVQGTTITEDAETIMSKANVIVTNSEGAPLTQLSGIGIRTNATLVYGIMYDPGDDTVKLGEGTLDANNEFTFNSGEGTAVATRADSTVWTNGHLAMWNAAEYRFIDSGIAADNVVTVNTTQQIEGVKSFSNPVYISDGTSRYTAEYSARYITAIDEPAGTTHTYNFPQGTGTLALTSDIPTDYVTEKEFSNLAQQVEDLYALGEQGGLFTVTTVEDTYTARETAGGNLNIADGVSTIVKTIEGSTVKCDNLIPYPYADTTKTVNGVTFTDNGDGSVKVNGTATANTDFSLKALAVQKNGNYFLSGCPSTGSAATYILYATDGVNGYADAGAGKLINPSSTNLSLAVRIYTGATLNNVVFKPMLNAGTTALPYQPYFKGLKNASFEKIVSTGKNLIPYPYAKGTTTINGVTFTDNGDGSITVNGTASDDAIFKTYSINLLANKIYFLSGCPAGGSAQAYYFQFRGFVIDVGHGTTIVAGYDFRNNCEIVIKSGTTVSNLVFKPMLNFGTTAQPYEPYKQSVLSLPSAVENPAYNTLDFQTGKNVSQGITKVFDGTEGWYAVNISDGYYRYALGLNVKGTGVIKILSNFMDTGTPETLPDEPIGIYLTNQDFSALVVWANKSNYPQFDTVDNWKAYLAAQYAAGDPLIVRYKTAEVQSEADLNASSDRYIAWKGGSETIVQGEVDNSEYGAENTVTQDYFTITGGTANGN